MKMPESPIPSSRSYDSRADTLAHIATVKRYLAAIRTNLYYRLLEHDRSKLAEPEKSTFDEFTPKLREAEYGSPEYKGFLEAMGPALQHHYERNSHHPEHYPSGIAGMSLLDLIEMLADWKAAGERHADGGDIRRSIGLNVKRFGISEQLEHILLNTVEELGW